MKKSKLIKIALLVVSFALILGVVIGFGVSAEPTEASIIAKNVVYGEKVSLAFAVDVTLDEADTAQVTYYWEGDEANIKTATLLDPASENGTYTDASGIKHPVFVTEGRPAKELGRVCYASVDGGKSYVTYSATQYLYDRLYKSNFVSKTDADGVDYNRKLLYENLLDYAANAQVVLNYNTTELANALPYAYTTDKEILINGQESAIGENEITVSYTGTGSLVSLNIIALDGSVTNTTKTTFSIDGIVKIEAVIGVHEHNDTDNDHLCDACSETVSECENENADHKCDICGKVVSYCADSNGDGKCDVCKLYSFEYTVTSGVSFLQFSTVAKSDSRLHIYQTTVSTETPTYPNFGCSGQLIADPADAANQVLRWAVNNGVKHDGTNQNTSNAANIDGVSTQLKTQNSLIKFEASSVAEGGNIHVLEMDFNLREIGKNKYNTIDSPFRLYAYNADGEIIGDFYKTSSGTSSYNGFMFIDQTNYKYSNSDTTPLYTLDDSDTNAYHFGNHTQRTNARSDASNVIMFDRNEWYRFRFVWDVSTNEIGMEVSFDDGANWYLCFSYTTANAITEGEEIAYLGFQLDTIYGIGMDILLDDVSYNVVSSYEKATDFGNDSIENSYKN